MNRFLIIITVFIISLGVASPIAAQTSREEKKAAKKEKKLWKNKARKYAKSPLSLRDDLETSKLKLRKCSEQNKGLQSNYTKLQVSYDSLSSILSSREAELVVLKHKYEKLEAAHQAQKNMNDKGIVPGLVYRIQVGAYVHFDMNQHLANTDKSFEGENQDGMNKYMMGNFRGIANAESFRNDIQKLGIKDAWVVPYIDGTRVTKDEASAYLSRQGN